MEEARTMSPLGPLNLIRTGLLSLATLTMLASCQLMPKPAMDHSEYLTPLDHLPVLRGDYFELHSLAVGRPFHIYVRLPETYAAGSTEFPVVYLLDGDSLFPILAANHLFLHYDESLPEAIVVGIAYGSLDSSVNARGFDFSAPAPDAGPEQGGAPAFHSFLENELLPEVESRYRADPSKRVLFGQSRGGYMVLYSAFTNPDLFWGRIASNPSFDPGREQFFESAAPSSRKDLGLVVTSGSRDYPQFREAALQWFEAWDSVEDAPWSLHPVTIPDGTHSADSTRSYRIGMLWLFGR
jgi:predicted alpha/beta superfamily hydrolase